MRIEQNIKDAINDRSEQIFNVYGVALKRGVAKCPFHDDKHASFIAKSDTTGRWKWKCLTCDHKGSDIFSFVAQMENLNPRTEFVEVVKRAAAACGLSHILGDADGMTWTPPPPRPKKIQEQRPPRYLNAEVEKMMQEYEVTNLYTYLCKIFDPAEVCRVMELYKVGRGYYLDANKQWNMSEKPLRLQNTINCNAFPSIDADGNAHAVKVVPYSANNGHRLKGVQGSKEMHTYRPEQNEGAYFGTHLLPLYPARPLAIVESEKSAIIGTLFAPDYIWIAVGGLQYFDPASMSQLPKLARLKGRMLHIFPDADGREKWKIRTEQLRAQGYAVTFRDEVIKLLPPESKLDIADIIIWEMEKGRNYE